MLQIQNISFGYTDATTVINNIDFNLEKGQNLAVLGESGCGKSTLLKLIYGLYDLKEGTILLEENHILGPKYNLVPGHEDMKYLAQEYDLMPYITVEENVGKFLSNIYPEQKAARVAELLEIVEMSAFAKVKAQFLSGGQQQRVALARVLALEPKVLLLDEPFSNIDSYRKGALRRNLFAYLKQKEVSCIIATHDSIDALSFSDKTLVMKAGEIIQFDLSKRLYLQPQNRYVASLFGEVNEVKASHFLSLDNNERTVLLYANELYLTDNSSLKVVVKKSYFKGGSYLIKAVYDRKVIFFENPFEIPDNTEVCLTADLEVVEIRL